MPSKKAGIGPSAVFFDLDEDGVRDAGEQLLRGVNVTLYRGDGTVVASVLTDVNGLYEFTINDLSVDGMCPVLDDFPFDENMPLALDNLLHVQLDDKVRWAERQPSRTQAVV